MWRETKIIQNLQMRIGIIFGDYVDIWDRLSKAKPETRSRRLLVHRTVG